MPTISVIVPVYNVEKYLHKCIDSILAQTFTDFELILVDDESTDSSGALCDEYAKEDNRIIVFHTKNNGPGIARNVALDWTINKSESDWIAFVDSDDTINKNFLEIMLKTAIVNGAQICGCDFVEYSDDRELEEYNSICEFDIKIYGAEEYYCEKYSPAPWRQIYSKNLWRNIRFPEGKNIIGEDAFVTYRTIFNCNKAAYICSPLYYYYQSPNSLFRSEWNPGKILALDALENQICFFKENHYLNALKSSVSDYSHWLYLFILECKENYTYKREYLALKKRLQRHLIAYKNKWNISINDQPQLFEVAFPVEMKVFWYWQAIKRKIRRK